MCCDHTVCSAQGKSVAKPNARHMQCLITSINRCNSGNRNGLTRKKNGR
jgi:hypothetical protein